MHSLIDVEDVAEALVFGLAFAGAIAILRDELQASTSTPVRPSRPRGEHLSEREVRQLEQGAEVTLHRLDRGPDYVLSAEPVDVEG